MGGIAAIARELGHEVSGSDQNVYPPMSHTLQALGITLQEGYRAEHLQPHPDLVIIGNALSRGNLAIEYVLNQAIPYASGPEWLAEHVLQHKHVLAVSGTHGKTTTTAFLIWILRYAGKNPGYLIGGVAQDLPTTASLGDSPYFVIEADEYDTAFFDKRSKFLHYRPSTLIINNLEFDHADIFPDLEAIKKQFQYLLRTVPARGLLIHNAEDLATVDVMSRGCWSRAEIFSSVSPVRGWYVKNLAPDAGLFDVYKNEEKMGTVQWSMLGQHNISNALAAIAAAADVGVPASLACEALRHFKGVKRRLEVIAIVEGVTVYDDFAHHPTAIQETVKALRRAVHQERIIAVLQFGSNTMKLGTHYEKIAPALKEVDYTIFLEPKDFSLQDMCERMGSHAERFVTVDEIVARVMSIVRPGDHVLIMSNKSFDGLHDKLVLGLKN